MATNAEKLAEHTTRLTAISETLSRGFAELRSHVENLERNSDLDFGPANETLSRIESAVAALDAAAPPLTDETETDEPAAEPETPAVDETPAPVDTDTPGPEAPVAPAPTPEVPADTVEPEDDGAEPETEESVESEPNTPA